MVRLQIVGFNYYPSVRISGEAKPGYTSGDAIAEMEKLTGQLPRGFGFEWTGQSLQEKLSGSQAPFILGLSALVVFLCLAALYESWTIPLAVLLDRAARHCWRRDRGLDCVVFPTTCTSPWLSSRSSVWRPRMPF